MKAEEVVRRLRELVNMAPGERPIPIERLAQVAGVHDQTIYGIAQSGSIGEISRKRLSQALTWVENDQVRVHKRPNRKTRVTIEDPRPPQESAYGIKLYPDAPPRLELRRFNPRTFPRRRKT